MTSTDQLFNLIQSMDMAEKKQFRLYASRHVIGEQNNYIRLFEAISKQKEYDEQKLIRQFRREAFARRMAVAKNYLYNQLLTSLQLQYSDSNPSRQCNKLIDQADILVDKTLFPGAIKLLRRAKKLAEKHELFRHLLTIQEIELKFPYGNTGRSHFIEDPEGIRAEMRKTIENIQNKWDYTQLAHKLGGQFAHRGAPRSRAEVKEYGYLYKNPLLQNEDRAITFQSTYLFHFMNTILCMIKNKPENAYQHRLKVLEMMRERPWHFGANRSKYLKRLTEGIYTLLNISIEMKQFDKRFFALLDELRAMRDHLPEAHKVQAEVHGHIFCSAACMELAYCESRKKTDEGLALIPAIRKGLKAHHESMTGELLPNLYYNIGMLYFAKKDFAESLNWFNQLRNLGNSFHRDDLSLMSEIITLIIHFELNNEQLLEYQIRNTYRHLIKKQRLFGFEKLILQFLKKEVPKITGRRSLLFAFKQLKKDLDKLKQDPFEKNAMSYFDLPAWLESKIAA